MHLGCLCSLLQTEMARWVEKLNSTAARSGSVPTRSQTLPARTDEPKDSSKKKGFLTFKKKQTQNIAHLGTHFTKCHNTFTSSLRIQTSDSAATQLGRHFLHVCMLEGVFFFYIHGLELFCIFQYVYSETEMYPSNVRTEQMDFLRV